MKKSECLTHIELSELIEFKNHLKDDNIKKIIEKVIEIINSAVIIKNNEKRYKSDLHTQKTLVKQYRQLLLEQEIQIESLEQKLRNEISNNVNLYKENLTLKDVIH